MVYAEDIRLAARKQAQSRGCHGFCLGNHVCMLIGTLIGTNMAYKVKMIQMPETVAILNGFGGGASTLVAITVLVQTRDILQVSEAKNVINCNFGTKLGYAGVDNPLYQSEYAHLFLGDAKETIGDLVRQLL